MRRQKANLNKFVYVCSNWGNNWSCVVGNSAIGRWSLSTLGTLQREREITITFHHNRKLSKNEIQQPNTTQRYLSVFEKKQKLKTTLCYKRSMDRRTSCKLHLYWQNRFQNTEVISNDCLKINLIRIKQSQEIYFENTWTKKEIKAERGETQMLKMEYHDNTSLGFNKDK